MAVAIRDVTSEEIGQFGDIIARLERLGPAEDAREAIFEDIIRLVRGEYGASYVWNAQAGCFEDALRFNLSAEHLKTYDEWFQFRDPMTHKLRALRRATVVEEVIPRRELVRTEFFNDFLASAGMHHGIDMFIFDDDRDLGDLRIWRGHRSVAFGDKERLLLDGLEPFLRRALKGNLATCEGLTPREREVAVLVARGCTDQDISQILGIGFATVRTHISRAMEKRGCSNRTELAGSLARHDN
jgi:DNA-binding CsgD family transcriptional regulator